MGSNKRGINTNNKLMSVLRSPFMTNWFVNEEDRRLGFVINDDLYKSWSHLIIVPLLVHYYYLLLGDSDKYFPINHPHWHILNLPCGSWQWSSYRIHVPLKLKLNYRKKMQKSVFVKVIVAAASAPPEPQHKTHKPSARTRIVISLPSSDLWPAKSARCFWSCRHQCLRYR